LYVPEVETVIVEALVPFDQTTVPAQLFTLNFTFAPAHTILSESSEVTIWVDGIVFTTIVCMAEAKLTQPFMEQDALYVPDEETVMAVVFVPFDQTTVPAQPLAVKVVNVPEQILVLPEILGVFGAGLIITVVVAAALSQLTINEHLKSYLRIVSDEKVEGIIEIELPLVQVPLFKRYWPLPELHETDKEKPDSVLHKLVLLAELIIIGFSGLGFTLIVVTVLTVWQVRFAVICCSRAT
jgi:hypothetical protein